MRTGALTIRRRGSQAAALAAAVLVAAASVGCISAQDPNRRAKQGSAIGAAAGAVAGAILGNQSGNPRTGAVVGAALGAGIGASIGHQRDQMAAEMRRISEVQVQRQQAENELRVIVSNSVLFDTDSAILRTASLSTLNNMAEVLSRYPDTRIVVTGYTDSEGSEEHNLQLSERRATSVRNYLISRGVRPESLTAVGLGESDPIDTNQTAQGRQNNRRVEFRVVFEG